MSALAVALAMAVVRGSAGVPANTCSGEVMGSDGSGGPAIALPHANVTGCGAQSVLTDRNGSFSVVCSEGHACLTVVWSVWARQYEPRIGTQNPTGCITLAQRPIPGFPASAWRFEGWAIDASELRKWRAHVDQLVTMVMVQMEAQPLRDCLPPPPPGPPSPPMP